MLWHAGADHYLPFLQVDAALFIFGVPLVKIMTKVPFRSTIYAEDVGVDTPFEGYFNYCTTLSENNAVLHVYIFIFGSPAGCRSVNSDHHGLLPPCIGTEVKDTEMLGLKCTINVANSFYYTNLSSAPTIEYGGDDGNYNLSFKSSERMRESGSRIGENSRAEKFKACLQKHYTNINVLNMDQLMPKVEGNVCMFSGEGDSVMVAALGSTLYCNTGDDNESCSGVSMECKYLTTQSNSAIEHQLKANMFLLTARYVIKTIENLQENPNPISALGQLTKVVTYGLSFGLVNPVLILKLTLDFWITDISYEKIYQSPSELPPEPRLDCALKYLIDRIAK